MRSFVCALSLFALLCVSAAVSASPRVRVTDTRGRTLITVTAVKGGVTVHLDGRDVSVIEDESTCYAEDDIGRPRSGVRVEAGGFELVDRVGDPLAWIRAVSGGYDCTRNDAVYATVRSHDGGFELRLHDRPVMTAHRTESAVEVRDPKGRLRCRVYGLAPERVALWWLVRGGLEEPAMLAALARGTAP